MNGIIWCPIKSNHVLLVHVGKTKLTQCNVICTCYLKWLFVMKICVIATEKERLHSNYEIIWNTGLNIQWFKVNFFWYNCFRYLIIILISIKISSIKPYSNYSILQKFGTDPQNLWVAIIHRKSFIPCNHTSFSEWT